MSLAAKVWRARLRRHVDPAGDGVVIPLRESSPPRPPATHSEVITLADGTVVVTHVAPPRSAAKSAARRPAKVGKAAPWLPRENDPPPKPDPDGPTEPWRRFGDRGRG